MLTLNATSPKLHWPSAFISKSRTFSPSGRPLSYLSNVQFRPFVPFMFGLWCVQFKFWPSTFSIFDCSVWPPWTVHFERGLYDAKLSYLFHTLSFLYQFNCPTSTEAFQLHWFLSKLSDLISHFPTSIVLSNFILFNLNSNFPITCIPTFLNLLKVLMGWCRLPWAILYGSVVLV